VQRNPSVPTPRRTDVVTPLFLRMPTVMRMTGLGRSTIYRLIAEHKFPSPVRLGPRAVAWRSSDLDEWSEARPVASH
jgi:prophage regulatory protein